MSLEPIGRLMQHAMDNTYALGYFESWNLESLQGVIDAAEKTRSPVLVGFNGEFLSHPDRLADERITWYAALGKAAAESASVPCGLVFNECGRDDWMRAAVKAGFGQVMFDDPEASPEDFASRTTELARFAHEHGAACEAGVGRLPSGLPDTFDEKGCSQTDPEAAAAFVGETGIDILAISVGNVHGMVNGQGSLDLDRLAAIRAKVTIPLDLHGGTGICDEDLREAISIGVTKVCYGTYIKQRYLTAVGRALGSGEPNPHKLLGMGGEEDVMVAGRLAVRNAVLERIDLLGCCGRA